MISKLILTRKHHKSLHNTYKIFKLVELIDPDLLYTHHSM